MMSDEPAAGPHSPVSDSAGPASDSQLIRAELRARWQEPPMAELSARRLELRRAADALRTIIEQMVSTAAPTDIIADAADELERVVASFKELTGGRDYAGFAEAANAGGERFASFEHSPFIGRANPLAPPMFLEDIDDVVRGRVTFGSAY